MSRAGTIIVGGGVIGITLAHELASRGERVTVLERGRAGHGCSYGNAGWITPCFAMPLPMPGMLTTALRWLGDPASPFHIRPRPSLTLLRWLVRFLGAMNERDFERGARALVELSQASLADYRALAATHGDFGFEARGLTIACETSAGLAMAEHERAIAERHGVRGERLESAALRARVPALRGTVVGGVHFPDEAHLDPLRFVESMARAARARGVTVLEDAEVIALEREGDRVTAVRTRDGVHACDRLVLATGSWSRRLAATIGLRVPVLGGKGYSMIAPNTQPAIDAPLYLIERRIAITPRGTHVRLAGTLEIVDDDHTIAPRRLEAIRTGAAAILAWHAAPVVEDVWRGLRPCTPDGLPLLGRAPRWTNLFLATGHQMLGMQTAPASARLVADLMTGAPPSFDPAPFRVDRP